MFLIKYYNIKYHYLSPLYINSGGNEFWAKTVRARQHETTYGLREFKGVVVVDSPFYASHPCPFSLFWLEQKALFWCLFFVSVQRTKAAPS